MVGAAPIAAPTLKILTPLWRCFYLHFYKKLYNMNSVEFISAVLQ